MNQIEEFSCIGFFPRIKKYVFILVYLKMKVIVKFCWYLYGIIQRLVRCLLLGTLTF